MGADSTGTTRLLVFKGNIFCTNALWTVQKAKISEMRMSASPANGRVQCTHEYSHHFGSHEASSLFPNRDSIKRL